MSSTKAALRLAEGIDDPGKLHPRGSDKPISTIDEFAKIAASSAARVDGVRDLGGPRRQELRRGAGPGPVGDRGRCRCSPGPTSPTDVPVGAALVRVERGPIINIDIGGGSLEPSSVDEEPDRGAVAAAAPAG